MRLQTLLEYDRERARQALGDGLWKAALRDQFKLWGKRLDQMQDYSSLIGRISTNASAFISDVYKRPDMQRDVADRALQEIESADPSTNKKYTQWMARQFATGNVAKLEDVVSTLADYVARFHELSTRKKLPVDRRDINRYKKPQDLFDAVEWYEDQDPDPDTKGTADKMYEDGDVTVIVPRDEAAACRYGRNTRWCTAATKGHNYFAQYNREGPLFIIIPKSPHRPREKYQLHFPSGQYMDEDDEAVSLSALIGDQFPGLGKFFMADPNTSKYIQDMVEFASDELLMKLSDDIWNLVQDKVYDVLSDWEINDDWYYQWLRDQGYFTDDDELKDDAPGYLDYNSEARDWLDKIEDLAHPSPDQLREITAQLIREGEFDEDTIYRVEDYIASNLHSKMRRNREETDGGIGIWIEKNIIIKRSPDGPRVELIKRDGK